MCFGPASSSSCYGWRGRQVLAPKCLHRALSSVWQLVAHVTGQGKPGSPSLGSRRFSIVLRWPRKAHDVTMDTAHRLRRSFNHWETRTASLRQGPVPCVPRTPSYPASHVSTVRGAYPLQFRPGSTPPHFRFSNAECFAFSADIFASLCRRTKHLRNAKIRALKLLS